METYRQGVFALIIDEESNVLIIQKVNYKENDWTMIGGGREENETPELNLFRELKEETGLGSDAYEIVGLATNKHKYEYPEKVAQTIHNGKYIGQEYDLFIIRLKEKKENLNFLPEEIKTHKWIAMDDLQNYLHFPNQFENFSKALNEVLNKTK